VVQLIIKAELKQWLIDQCCCEVTALGMQNIENYTFYWMQLNIKVQHKTTKNDVIQR